MKKNKIKQSFLDELKRIPIIQVACEKCGISRTSVYRWLAKDKEFKKQLEEALAEGEALVNDMSEGQLLTLIKEKNYPAISFWLRHRNPKFKDKVEITAKVESENVALSPEQEELLKEALRLALPNSNEQLKP